MTLHSAIPVLRVGDYPRARAFRTSVMGFAAVEEGGDPPRFGIFRRVGQTVFVDAWHGADTPPSPGWRACLHTDDVDTLAGAPVGQEEVTRPRDTAYGMREIEGTDPSGNRLCFGQDSI